VIKIGLNRGLDDFEQEKLTDELRIVSPEHILEKINNGLKRKQTKEGLLKKSYLVIINWM
jgi:hypothetical protein